MRISRRVEEMAIIIRAHVVQGVVARARACRACLLRPSPARGGAAEGLPWHCLSCSEVYGNELGRQIEEAIVRKLVGARVRIPSPLALVSREKRRRIRKEFNGANTAQLALQYNMSRPAVYRALAEKED